MELGLGGALKSKAKQAKKEFQEEQGKISSYLEKIEDLKMAANIQVDHCHRAKESQWRAKKERKQMVATLAKAIKDRTFVNDLLLGEQERSDDLARRWQLFRISTGLERKYGPRRLVG